MSTVDEILTLLASEQRRYALYYLRQCDGPVSIGELVEAIEATMGDRVRSSDGSDTRRQLEIELRHVHLPKADRFDCLHYDPSLDLVEYVAPSPLLEDILDQTEAIDRSPDAGDPVLQ